MMIIMNDEYKIEILLDGREEIVKDNDEVTWYMW